MAGDTRQAISAEAPPTHASAAPAAEPVGDGGRSRTSDAGSPAAAGGTSRVQTFITVAPVMAALVLIVLFIAFLAVLYVDRGDENWDRMIFLLAGLEAIVFAGAGALFGTTVQRGTVQAARQDAAEAKADAAVARTRAEETTADATAGVALYRVVQEKAAAAAPAAAGQGARPREGVAQPADADLAELAAIARALFRDR